MFPENKDFTIVYQGPVVRRGDINITANVTAITRRINPGAKIIFSTWTGQDITDVIYDEVVYSDDPGTQTPYGYKVNNVNRQIISSINGLSIAQTPYSVKIRTDCALNQPVDQIYRHYSRYLTEEKRGKLAFLKERVLTMDYSSVNPRKSSLKLLFHPCDWFFLGRTDDLKGIFDIPLASKEFFHYFIKHSKPSHHQFPDYAEQFQSENYIWMNAVRKHVEVDFEHGWIYNEHLCKLSEETIAANLVIVPSYRIGIVSGVHKIYIRDKNRYNFTQWKQLSNWYCNTKYSLFNLGGIPERLIQRYYKNVEKRRFRC